MLFQVVIVGVVVSRGIFWSCCFKGTLLEFLFQGMQLLFQGMQLLFQGDIVGVFVSRDGVVEGIDVVEVCGGGFSVVVLILISSNPLGLFTATLSDQISTLNV